MDQSTLDAFLQGLLSPVGAGVALWLLVGWLFKVLPDTVTSEAKFWITLVAAFVIPPGAFGLRIFLGYDVFTWEQLFLAVGAGYMISQGVHRGSEAAGEKLRKGPDAN